MPTRSAPSAIHVAAAAEAAVDDDPRPPGDRGDDLRQEIERAAAMIELPAAMVRDIDRGDAVLAGERRVLGGGDPFQDQRHVVLVPEALHVIPVERRLEFPAAGALAPGLGEPLGDIAL